MATKTKYIPEPDLPIVSRRSGCKVEWKTYATRKHAEIASKWAKQEARRKAEMGFDFGYQSPGSIEAVTDGFEVCFP